MTTVTVVVPLKIRQWGGRKAIIAPDGPPLTPEEARSGRSPLAAIRRW